MRKRILVIDIGGTHVKLMISRAKKRKFKSGQKLTPREMVKQIKMEIDGWKFDAISIGFPSPVRDGRILAEPKHLGKGWVRFNFEKALGKPVRVVNDAALQALGSYHGGRMLFLGLGTGLGSTLVFPDMVLPLELYFLGHGEADWPDWEKSDDARPLTKRGKKEMHEVAAFLKRVKARPDLVVTSPLPRASQTAEIAAEHLKVKCREDKLLAPGFGRQELERLLKKYPAESLMIVGHEPDFTQTISQLTGASLKLSKAGVALVELDRSWRNGRLLWLFPPKIAKK